MHIKSIVVGAAIALAATVGSVSAADHFTTLAGVPAQPLTVGAVENAASNRFAALEGIAAQAMTTRDLESVVGGDDNNADFQINFPTEFPAHLNRPIIDGAACAGISNSRAFTFAGC